MIWYQSFKANATSDPLLFQLFFFPKQPDQRFERGVIQREEQRERRERGGEGEDRFMEKIFVVLNLCFC
jgi:hypothetical protein